MKCCIRCAGSKELKPFESSEEAVGFRFEFAMCIRCLLELVGDPLGSLVMADNAVDPMAIVDAVVTDDGDVTPVEVPHPFTTPDEPTFPFQRPYYAPPLLVIVTFFNRDEGEFQTYYEGEGPLSEGTFKVNIDGQGYESLSTSIHKLPEDRRLRAKLTYAWIDAVEEGKCLAWEKKEISSHSVN